MIDAIYDKNSNTYKNVIENLTQKIHTQEKIVDIKILQEQYCWQVTDRLKELNEKLICIKENEMSMDTLLTLDLNTYLDELIEVILSEMKYHTIIFQKELPKQKNSHKQK